MRTLYLFLSIFCFFNKILCDIPKFFILVPTYNNEKYCIRNLETIAYQYSTLPYEIHIVNDASTDKTGILINEYKQKHNLKFVKIIHNANRVGSLENIFNTIHKYCSDDKIVVCVDGDDALSDAKNVLMRLELEYLDPNIWITYGSFREYPSHKKGFCREIPISILENKKLRKYPFVVSHLRTFRAGLFKKIKKEDLQHNGKFLPVAGDVAFMLPMLEMAAPIKRGAKNHSSFIKDMLYDYNMFNPLSDFKIKAEQQKFYGNYITRKPPYHPLTKL